MAYGLQVGQDNVLGRYGKYKGRTEVGARIRTRQCLARNDDKVTEQGW